MPYLDDENDPEESLDERELPDPSDVDDRDTHPCPHCGREIYDDAEQCPACGNYITPGSENRKPIWIILAVIVCTLIVLGWVFRGNL